MTIAVIGATGLIGKPVTQQLIDAGFTVTILARHPEQARALFPKAHSVQADLQNPESIRAGLQNQQALYLNLSVRQDEKPGDFHKGTDQEAVRVVAGMPNWRFGKQSGRAVNVSCNLPINFSLK